MFAVIGGSGFTQLPELRITHRRIVRTPYGLTSSPILSGQLGSQELVFLARHGFGHTIAPHKINYRANIWALHSLGVDNIIAVSSVISINEQLENGGLIMPHDVIDYTYSRLNTFFEGQDQPVVHTDFSEPYSAELRDTLIHRIHQNHQISVYTQAVYGCLQGPRWPTRAEIRRYQNDGVDVLGMTGMPEAILARELGMKYIHFCGIAGVGCTSNPLQNSCTEGSYQAIHKIRSLLANL